jgi:hypothetical protein
VQLKLLDMLLHQVTGGADYNRTSYCIQVGQPDLFISHLHIVVGRSEVNVPRGEEERREDRGGWKSRGRVGGGEEKEGEEGRGEDMRRREGRGEEIEEGRQRRWRREGRGGGGEGGKAE